MGHLMLVQIRLLRELLATRLACERLLTGVHHEMTLQIGQLVEALVARVADERSLAGVDLLMLVQAALRRERLLALLALEALLHLRRMPDKHVRLQLRLSGKILEHMQHVCFDQIYRYFIKRYCVPVCTADI